MERYAMKASQKVHASSTSTSSATRELIEVYSWRTTRLCQKKQLLVSATTGVKGKQQARDHPPRHHHLRLSNEAARWCQSNSTAREYPGSSVG